MDKLDEMTLEALIDRVDQTQKAADLAYALVHFCGLPDNRSAYSWIGLMSKRYGLELVKNLTFSVLETGTTLEDFDNEPRHFRAWFVATLKGQSQDQQQGGLRVFA